MPFGLSVENWITIILGVPILGIIGYVTRLVFVLNGAIKNLNEIPKIQKTLVALKVEIESIDYATAKHYGNGYMQTKADKRKELIELYKLREE